MIAATRCFCWAALLPSFFCDAVSWEEEVKSWQTELWEWHVERAFLQMHPRELHFTLLQARISSHDNMPYR